jgi:hypothetical protein
LRKVLSDRKTVSGSPLLLPQVFSSKEETMSSNGPKKSRRLQQLPATAPPNASDAPVRSQLRALYVRDNHKGRACVTTSPSKHFKQAYGAKPMSASEMESFRRMYRLSNDQDQDNDNSSSSSSSGSDDDEDDEESVNNIQVQRLLPAFVGQVVTVTSTDAEEIQNGGVNELDIDPESDDESDDGDSGTVDSNVWTTFQSIDNSAMKLLPLGELKTLIESSCKCKTCGANLTLTQRTCGIATSLTLICDGHPKHYFELPAQRISQETQSSGQSSLPKAEEYPINCMLMLAMQLCGLGMKGANTFLGLLGMRSNFLRHDNWEYLSDTVGEAMEKVSDLAMKNNVVREIAATKEAGVEAEEDGRIGITASVDGAWQKRSSGMKFDSPTGHNLLFGARTLLPLLLTVYSKLCATCDQGSNKKKNTTSNSPRPAAAVATPAAAVATPAAAAQLAAAAAVTTGTPAQQQQQPKRTPLQEKLWREQVCWARQQLVSQQGLPPPGMEWDNKSCGKLKAGSCCLGVDCANTDKTSQISHKCIFCYGILHTHPSCSIRVHDESESAGGKHECAEGKGCKVAAATANTNATALVDPLATAANDKPHVTATGAKSPETVAVKSSPLLLAEKEAKEAKEAKDPNGLLSGNNKFVENDQDLTDT